MGGGRGGQKRGRTHRRQFKHKRENVWERNRRPDDNPSWEPFATQNPAFEDYYKEQKIVPEGEWEEFMSMLRKPLPAAFRINSSGQFFRDIRYQLENDIMKSLDTEIMDDNAEEAIRPLPWYPENLAWQLNFSRMQLRKNQTLERIHEFLKKENEIGNITRQEAVSMVPPLFLDVKSDHYILDMCAAPGSKTFQLLEMIHQSDKPGSLPEGMVIANDVDIQRCNLLIHQTKRMCSANLIVTNHEAQHFPSCRVNQQCFSQLGLGSACEILPEAHGIEGPLDQVENQLLFDRILCDVPCSGDGTLRKAPDIWRKWNAGMGNGLHHLQVQIAMRGIYVLKVGGRLVYSTCSMNPIEDEAVVGEVRDRGHWLTSYKQVPTYRKSGIVPSMFPSGEDWEKVPNGEQENFGAPVISIDQEKPTGEERSERGCGMHHEQDSAPLEYENEVSNLPLERCMRIMPHDQNSGAFFIAVLRKVSPLPDVQGKPNNVHRISALRDHQFKANLMKASVEAAHGNEMESSAPAKGDFMVEISEDVNDNEIDAYEVDSSLDHDDLDKETPTFSAQIAKVGCSENCDEDNEINETEEIGGEKGLNRIKKREQVQGRWRGVDPVVLFTDDAIINSIRTFYGIKDSFPFHGHLVTRNSDSHHVKRIYYISKKVHDTLKLNIQVGQQLKIFSLGLKIFERQTSKDALSPCLYRISSEALPLLLPYMTKQILTATVTDFKHLLQYKTIKFGDFVDNSFREKASNLFVGCFVIVMHRDQGPISDSIVGSSSTIAIGCWKGRTNISVMVSPMECEELLERLSLVSPQEDKAIINTEVDAVKSVSDGEFHD
ncbi:hypothetical protein AMTRI_Chr04g245650 [Amborella trichopoda]